MTKQDESHMKYCINEDLRRIYAGKEPIPKMVKEYTGKELEYAAQYLDKLDKGMTIEVRLAKIGYGMWSVRCKEEID